MKKTHVLALAALGVAAAATPMALGFWNPLTETYTEGVDVSGHQGRIDWDALARSDVHFAYIKATEGASFVDQRFAANWAGATNSIGTKAACGSPSSCQRREFSHLAIRLACKRQKSAQAR